VVTSRDSLAGLVTRHGARRLGLDLLPAADAVALLERLIGDRARRTPAAAAIAERCARLPLALRIVAEYATAHPTATLADLARLLADEPQRVELLDAGGDPRIGLSAVFFWSYRHLKPAARRLFRLLGVHPCPDLDTAACAALAGVPVPEARRLMRDLARAHLVRCRRGRHATHDLLRDYARQRHRAEDAPGDRAVALARLFDHYLAAAASAVLALGPDTAPGGAAGSAAADARRWLDAERHNLVALCALADRWPEPAGRLAAIVHGHLDGGPLSADRLTGAA
jgi:hypothetical protein